MSPARCPVVACVATVLLMGASLPAVAVAAANAPTATAETVQAPTRIPSTRSPGRSPGRSAGAVVANAAAQASQAQEAAAHGTAPPGLAGNSAGAAVQEEPRLPAGPNDVLLPFTDRQVEVAAIEVAKLEREADTAEIALPGTVAVPPQQLLVVAAPAAGMVESMLVTPDETVHQGQPIARLRSTELVEAQRLFLQAVANDHLARERLQRDELMYKERIIAERRLLTTRAEAFAARAALDERRQMLGLLGMPDADVRKLQSTRQISSTLTLHAPRDGVVLLNQVSAGERVAAAAPLFTVAHLDPLWVNLQVPLARAAALAAAAEVAIPAAGAKGRVLRIGRSVDPSTQSTSAVAEITSHPERLRPGQAVTVTVALPRNGSPQWRVPAGAVVRHQDRMWIFRRVPDGFLATPVTLLSETSQYASIRARVGSEEEVATRGLLILLAALSDRSGS